MRTISLLYKIWIAIAVLFLLAAFAVFTGEKESEVAGNLVFAMLVLGLPSSLLAYPVSFFVAYLFEGYGMYAYNSRIVLFSWWLVYFILGAVQWIGLMLIIRHRKLNQALNSDG